MHSVTAHSVADPRQRASDFFGYPDLDLLKAFSITILLCVCMEKPLVALTEAVQWLELKLALTGHRGHDQTGACLDWVLNSAGMHNRVWLVTRFGILEGTGNRRRIEHKNL